MGSSASGCASILSLCVDFPREKKRSAVRCRHMGLRIGRGPFTTRNSTMKRHSMFVATTLAGALAIAMPAIAAGPLGAISGGAGGGVMGTLGGTLSGPASNLGFGGAGMLGGTSQFQGVMTQPDLAIQRPAIPSVTPNLGLGAGGALDAAGQVQGEISRPDLNVPGAPVRRATGTVQSVRDRAQSRVDTAGDVVSSTAANATGAASGTASSTAGIAQSAGRLSGSASADGNASVQGGASARGASLSADGSANASAKAGF
jgi:hypothetical protein